MFYQNRNKLKNAKVQISERNGTIYLQMPLTLKANKNVDYVVVDINCQLKVFFKNSSNFFENISDLKNLIVEENTE